MVEHEIYITYLRTLSSLPNMQGVITYQDVQFENLENILLQKYNKPLIIIEMNHNTLTMTWCFKKNIVNGL